MTGQSLDARALGAPATVRQLTGAAECTAIIVTYNSAADIGGLLDALPAAAAGRRLRIVVVDNASSDNTADVVARYPDVMFLPTGANLGYAGAVNAGRRLGPAGAVLILNPDVRPAPDSIGRLVDELRKSGIGAAVPRMLDGTGALYPSLRREPSLTRAFGDAVLGRRWPGRPGWLSEMIWARPRYERASTVDWATGAVLAVSPLADRAVGPWDDELFFLYSEETDYCRRLRDAGLAIRYVPDAVFTHSGGGSGGGPDLVALTAVNRVRYYRKHHRRPASIAFRLVVLLGELLRARRPGDRHAVRALIRERRWASLPGGRA